MRDWRKVLQSKAMRNVALAMFLATAAGIYAVEARNRQPVADSGEVDAEKASHALAYRELDTGLPPLPSPGPGRAYRQRLRVFSSPV